MSTRKPKAIQFDPKIPAKLQKEFQRLLALVMYEYISKLEQTDSANIKDYFYLHLHGESVPTNNGLGPTPLPQNEKSEVYKLFRGLGHYSLLWNMQEVTTVTNGIPTSKTIFTLKSQFLLCAKPLDNVRIGQELCNSLILQSSSSAEYKRLGATTILGHKKVAMKNYKLANAFGVEFCGLTPSKDDDGLKKQLENWTIPSGCNVEDLVKYVLGRMWWRECTNGKDDNLLDVGLDDDAEEDVSENVVGNFNSKLPITRKNYPIAPKNYFFNGYMCWQAFSRFTCENMNYSLIAPEGKDLTESEKKSKGRAAKRKKALEDKIAKKQVENAMALGSGRNLPHGVSFTDSIRAKGIHVKGAEVKQKSQTTLLTSLTKQMEISERLMEKYMDKIITAKVVDNLEHPLWNHYNKEYGNFEKIREQITTIHLAITNDLNEWEQNTINMSVETYTSVDSRKSIKDIGSNYETPPSKVVFDDLQRASTSTYSNAVVFTDEKGIQYGTCMYGSKCIVETKTTNHVCMIDGCKNWVCDSCNPFEYDDNFENSLTERVCCTCYIKGSGITKSPSRSLSWTVYDNYNH